MGYVAHISILLLDGFSFHTQRVLKFFGKCFLNFLRAGGRGEKTWGWKEKLSYYCLFKERDTMNNKAKYTPQTIIPQIKMEFFIFLLFSLHMKILISRLQL
jgi:hypothetical protein